MRNPQVALLVETSIQYGCEILRGIARYLKPTQPWSIFFEQRERLLAPPAWLKTWRGQGAICRRATPKVISLLRRNRIKVVDLDDIEPASNLPGVESDQRAIGAMAAEYFRERGFRNFAFCGFRDERWSIERGEGFTQDLRTVGLKCDLWQTNRSGPREAEQSRLSRWLAKLPKPVAILASNDVRGQQVLDACHRADLAVPESVAVMGVDDDEILCTFCRPALSSITPNAELIGYKAAELLDHLMAGGEPPPSRVLVKPLRIRARQSTDVLAIRDPVVASIVRFIRENMITGLRMKDVMKHSPISRSLLERRFRQCIGRSPQAEIRSLQLKRVKELLINSELSLEKIARLAGYRHPEYMSVVFKRVTGQTPGEFRRTQLLQARASMPPEENRFRL
jgi:LacI family transcriptional regulator